MVRLLVGMARPAVLAERAALVLVVSVAARRRCCRRLCFAPAGGRVFGTHLASGERPSGSIFLGPARGVGGGICPIGLDLFSIGMGAPRAIRFPAELCSAVRDLFCRRCRHGSLWYPKQPFWRRREAWRLLAQMDRHCIDGLCFLDNTDRVSRATSRRPAHSHSECRCCPWICCCVDGRVFRSCSGLCAVLHGTFAASDEIVGSCLRNLFLSLRVRPLAPVHAP